MNLVLEELIEFYQMFYVVFYRLAMVFRARILVLLDYRKALPSLSVSDRYAASLIGTCDGFLGCVQVETAAIGCFFLPSFH